MITIADWNGRKVTCGVSKGGVVALPHPYDNLIRTDISPWPPADIVQKLYKSNHGGAFVGEDHEVVTSGLGFYCDLQSIHSEDVITWSVFGPVKYAEKDRRIAFVRKLMELANLSVEDTCEADIWMWRRVPHPDTLVTGGPEIDFGIRADETVILGEAKWRSHVGKNQGKKKDKDQITLRTEFLRKLGGGFYEGVNRFVVLGVGLLNDLVSTDDVESPGGTIYLRNLTWDAICEIEEHPCQAELARYFAWKKQHSKLD